MQGETLQEEPQEKTAEKKEAFAKYTAKDSVFTTLFQDKKYLMQLYRALHPEDMETMENKNQRGSGVCSKCEKRCLPAGR